MLLDIIKNNDPKNIAFIKIGKGSYAVLYKNGNKARGSDVMSNEVLELILDHKIPAIDLSQLSQDKVDIAAKDLPMAAMYPDPPPYGSLSKAPIEFVCNLAKLIGANVYNVPDIDIPSNLLRNTTSKEKAMFKAFFSKDYESMAQKALIREDLSILELPDVMDNISTLELVKLGVEILHEHESLRDESMALLTRFNKIATNERLKANPGQGMDLFTQHLMKNAQYKALLEVYGAVAYESVLLSYGNFDINLSWARLAEKLTSMADFHASKPRGRLFDQPLHFHSESSLSYYVKYANKAVERSILASQLPTPKGAGL